ncbi:MAG: hypothetical protein F2838_07955 [Actinobacteria bacterium]|nr:hypothetical protein [Actinomycetota bacterium]MSX38217.1 hypothetical protein [Actinomycetota bacterium]
MVTSVEIAPGVAARREIPWRSLRLRGSGRHNRRRFPRAILLVASALALMTYIPPMSRPLDLASVDYRRNALVGALALAIIVACTSTAVAGFEEAMRRRGGRLSPGGLVAAVALSGAVASLTAVVLDRVGLFPFPDVQAPVLGLRMSIGLTGMLWLIRLSESHLSKEVDITRGELRNVRQNQRLILDSDEGARREMAAFLHDRVQGGLLVVGMQLRRIAESASSPDADELLSVVERVEAIRQEEVRDVARRLSPPIREAGLYAVLIDLSRTWSAAMKVTVRLDVEVQETILGSGNRDLELAVYRIVEQALLNAAGHGQASEVSVEVTCDRPNEVVIRVADDGLGLEANAVSPGSGLAVISVWAGLMGGTWSLDSTKGSFVLTVHMPLVRPVILGRFGDAIERRDTDGDRRRTSFGRFASRTASHTTPL